jgi:uncharacterized protein YkwD
MATMVPGTSNGGVAWRGVLLAAAFLAAAAVASAANAAPATTRPTTRPLSAAELKQLVIGDADVVAKASTAVGDLAKLRAAEEELETHRRSAWENLRRLTGGPKDETVKAGKQNHDRLSVLLTRLNATYGHQSRAVEALARRAARLESLRKLDRTAAAVADADTARLTKLAEAAVGFAPSFVAEYQTTDLLTPPEEEDRRGLWLYVVSRRIDAYNRVQVEPLMEHGEVAHARRLNAYREMLGLLPLELDARLVQSARRHSKEMIGLSYFSHASPTEGLRSPFHRMAAAGYDRPANENIHMGRWDGEESFWKLFYSPGHHKAMVSERYSALGVGRWDMAWTENFGAGRRLMLASAEQRAAAKVNGQALGPQRIDASKKRGPLDLSNIRVLDPLGPRRTAGGPTTRRANPGEPREAREGRVGGRGGGGENFPLDR